MLTGMATAIAQLMRQREQETRNLQRNHMKRVELEAVKNEVPFQRRRRQKRPQQDDLFDPIRQQGLF